MGLSPGIGIGHRIAAQRYGSINVDSSVALVPAFHVSGGAPATTASFTAPAGSLLVATTTQDSGHYLSNPAGLAFTSTVTGMGVTWTKQATSAGLIKTDAGLGNIRGEAAVWTAPIVSATTGTVTLNDAGSLVRGATLKVYVVTGQNAAPLGNLTQGNAVVPLNAAYSASPTYTSVVAASRGFAAHIASWDTAAPYASTDPYAVNGTATSPQHYGLHVYKGANGGAAGSTVPFAFANANGITGVGSAFWALQEIKPT